MCEFATDTFQEGAGHPPSWVAFRNDLLRMGFSVSFLFFFFARGFRKFFFKIHLFECFWLFLFDAYFADGVFSFFCTFLFRMWVSQIFFSPFFVSYLFDFLSAFDCFLFIHLLSAFDCFFSMFFCGWGSQFLFCASSRMPVLILILGGRRRTKMKEVYSSILVDLNEPPSPPFFFLFVILQFCHGYILQYDAWGARFSWGREMRGGDISKQFLKFSPFFNHVK